MLSTRASAGVILSTSDVRLLRGRVGQRRFPRQLTSGGGVVLVLFVRSATSWARASRCWQKTPLRG